MTDLSPGYGVQFIGPFPAEHRVVVDGRAIPYLSAAPSADGTTITLSLDHRFIIEGTAEEVAKWVHFMANAMAVAAGYSYLGAEKKHEIFAPQMVGLAPSKPALHLVKESPEGTPTPQGGRDE